MDIIAYFITFALPNKKIWAKRNDRNLFITKNADKQDL